MGKTLLVLLLLTNSARMGAHTPVLAEDWILDLHAQTRAEELCAKDQFDHRGWQAAFVTTRFKWHGENLAEGSGDMKKVEAALYASPGHKANILNEHFTSMGIGYAPGCKLTVELYGG